ncbi:UNVERIFIED_CONTAM: hypothetical protein HDU68_002511, partial [Siphonaria sp. JEL0065]
MYDINGLAQQGASPIFLTVLLRKILTKFLKPCIEDHIQSSSLDNLKKNCQFVDTHVSSAAVLDY